MKKILALFFAILLVSNVCAINYDSDMDSLELHRIDSLCSIILLPYKEKDIYTKSNVRDYLTYDNVKNLSKCHLAYYTIDKYIVPDLYELELWFQLDNGKLFLFKTIYFLKQNIIDFLKEYFIVGDYRKKYPKVQRWNLIRDAKICIGMTKEECKLSMGSPNDTNRTVLQSGTYEQWVYDNIYVYFKGNRITSFQD